LHAEAVEQNVDLAPVVTCRPALLLFKIGLDYADGIAYNVAPEEPCTRFYGADREAVGSHSTADRIGVETKAFWSARV
jgi:hypothetical protein